MNGIAPPLALLAELTHRCPLQCPYCSNPLALDRARDELETEIWLRVLSEAAALGCLQVHFSGGEPAARRDLEALVKQAADCGLYTNLITSGVLLDEARLARLAEAGLEHVQLSFQDSHAANADRIAGFAGHRKKIEIAGKIRAAGLPLTANFVVHRQNLANTGSMIALGVELGAERIEIAHVQYYGWALKNRTALIPTRDDLARATAVVEQARTRFNGAVVIDYVVPDYYAKRPKACMGGWGRRFLNISPSGKVLPCHAAESIAGLVFENVRDRPLAAIWESSEAFQRFRGIAWMPEPCRSCERAEIDWGGCRCQAFALTGDAANTDPACALSPDHAMIADIAAAESAHPPGGFIYRRHSS
ncbi:MAG TPA: pyrroloquinoline quinone biosynthesis protein PqqE [Rhizomicrobium sp.]|nr:pyrroloquinoline quinone biosynthesis protein PqqE [Rhizomicrobium sp.]